VELFLGGDYKVSIKMLHVKVHGHGFDYWVSWSHYDVTSH